MYFCQQIIFFLVFDALKAYFNTFYPYGELKKKKKKKSVMQLNVCLNKAKSIERDIQI